MTYYDCINIKSKNTALIQEVLEPYKKEALDYFDQRCLKDEMLNEFYEIEKPCIIMFDDKENDYITVIYNRKTLSPPYEMKDLSRAIQAPCLYTLFYDEDYYVIELYDKGDFITRLQKESNGVIEDSEFNESLLFEVLAMNEEQQRIFREALQEKKIDESFYRLEYAFNTLLVIDYDHMDKKDLERCESRGVKYTII